MSKKDINIQSFLPGGTGDFLTDLQTAGADLASLPGEFATGLSNVVGSIPGGITDLVDNFQRAVGLKPSGAVYSSSPPPGRPTGGIFQSGDSFDPKDDLMFMGGGDPLYSPAVSSGPFGNIPQDTGPYYDMFGNAYATKEARDEADAMYGSQSGE